MVFDLVAEVTQSATVTKAGVPMDVVGGVTLVIDPDGDVRFAIYKSPDSDSRHARQRGDVAGPLRDLWAGSGLRARPVGDMFRRLHDQPPAPPGGVVRRRRTAGAATGAGRAATRRTTRGRR